MERDRPQDMKGTEAAAYKRMQRLGARFDPWPVVTRLCAEGAPFVIGDLTDIERPQARKTAYVGRLPPKEKSRRQDFWVLLLRVPLRGRMMPCEWWTFSSRTLEQEASSQSREVQQAMERLLGLLQVRPLVLDRGVHNRAFFAWRGQQGITWFEAKYAIIREAIPHYLAHPTLVLQPTA